MILSIIFLHSQYIVNANFYDNFTNIKFCMFYSDIKPPARDTAGIIDPIKLSAL